jgi:hypothetical protein
MSFQGNEKIKPVGVKVSLTMEQIKEYIKCQEDVIYFMSNYAWVFKPGSGNIKFQPYDYQKKFARMIVDNRFVISKFPRQAGKSTTTALVIVWMLMFSDPDKPVKIMIAAHKSAAASEIMARIKMTVENTPLWMQQGIVTWNAQSIQLENGSRVNAVTTTEDTGRSGSYDMIFLDEFAFVEENIAQEFYSAAYPTISSSSTSKVVIASTPNGMNLFYNMWTQSLNKTKDPENWNGFEPIEIKWDDVPGRGEEYKQITLRALSNNIERWNQEFECTFLGGDNTLIPSWAVAALTFMNPIENLPEKVKIFKRPDPKNRYMICVDTSRGKGVDFSAFTVIDITSTPYEVVATFRNDTITTLYYPNIIFNTARIYNDALALIETNDLGQQVVDILYHSLEYENILACENKGRVGQVLSGSASSMGVNTSVKTKNIGCSTLRSLCENKQLIVNDFEIIKEMSKFVRTGNTYRAEPGTHDDLIMTLVIFAWATSQPYFLDLTDQNIREIMYAKRIQQAEEELVPFGFIHEGNEEDDVIETDFF